MKNFRKYVVDLSLSGEDRWQDLLKDERALKKAEKLLEEVYSPIEDYLSKYGAWGVKQFIKIVFFIIGTKGLDYDEDINVWAEYLGDKGKILLGNLSYEINQAALADLSISGWLQTLNPFACSSVAFYVKNLGMVHARNLDWDLMKIKKSTIIIDYINADAGDFTVVSFPGYVGVLSGVAKGRFSATINMAPAVEGPYKQGWAAGFLLRYIFENCDSYEKAVKFLKKQASIFPFFVQITGAKKGQAAVIEMMPESKNTVYKFDGKPLGVTNHYLEDDEEYYEDDTFDRLAGIEESAAATKAGALKGLANDILLEDPVFNCGTVQSMIFHPKSGEYFLNKL